MRLLRNTAGYVEYNDVIRHFRTQINIQQERIS